MNSLATPIDASSRLQRLIGFLERDPANMQLLTDTVSAALEERQFDLAAGLIGEANRSSSPTLLNLRGLVALALQRFDDALPIFEQLRAEGADDPAIRFNLAWAKAMTGDFASANQLLDDDAIAVSQHAPSLKIRAMHHLELYEEALALGAQLADQYPNDAALMGSMATLAMDADKLDLVRTYAVRAEGNAEGLVALGMLELDQQALAQAGPLFDRAIEAQPGNARAWIGKGLGLIASGDAQAAADALDKGAALFEDHLGSWIAAGWAYFLSKDHIRARAGFERALEIDPNFSESHAGLAVLDIADGDMESARRRCDIAIRLDRKSFGGALARSMLLDREGHHQAADKIREIALTTPVGPDGRTIAQALVGFGGLRH